MAKNWWRTGFRAADFSERFERFADDLIPPHRKKANLLQRPAGPQRDRRQQSLQPSSGQAHRHRLLLLNPRLEARRGDELDQRLPLGQPAADGADSGGHNKLLLYPATVDGGEGQGKTRSEVRGRRPALTAFRLQQLANLLQLLRRSS